MVRLLLVLLVFISFSCNEKKPPGKKQGGDFNQLAEKYVRLGLYIGQFDPVFVDAYYGPDSLKPPTVADTVFPKDSLLIVVHDMITACKSFSDSANIDESTRSRAAWMEKQLVAFGRRIKWFAGDHAPFDLEAKELFDVEPPVFAESHFQSLVASLDSLLPGTGTVQQRAKALSDEFIIPKNKVDTVFKAAYHEARKRSGAQIEFPAGESFVFEYVTNKPWSGYNWYKGNYKSVIQQNLDLPIAIERAIDLACHEGYPGHHVYNMLLEKNLYRDKGWVEISLYPLYSPQSLIAEGSANYGIEMAFPGREKIDFATRVLFPLAGLDTSKADIYFRMLEIKEQLNYARNEAARGLMNGTMKEAAAIKWMMDYMLVSEEQAVKFISFIRANHSYVICYNYGQDLVKDYIESENGNSVSVEKRWNSFRWLLSNPVLPRNLIAAGK